MLINYFLSEAREEGQKTAGISDEALSVMMKYPWPGNVRELQSAVRFAIVKAGTGIIQLAHMPLELKEFKAYGSSRGPARKLDKEIVKAALIESGGNKAKAARILGVGRATLYRFLADYPDVS